VKFLQTYVLAILLVSCSTGQFNTQKDDIVLFTYNVENLFDTVHDRGKNDLSYLPIEDKKGLAHQAECEGIKVKRWRDECLYNDWSPKILDRKMERLAHVILQEDVHPHIIFLQEVENINVLEMLRKKYLAKSGYTKKSILIEGPDRRGIDTAMISKLDLASKPKIHITKFEGHSPTRAILEATFKLPNGDLITAFSLHLPSQRSPSKARRKVLKTLRNAIDKLPKNRMIVAAGDFNITKLEDIREKLLEESLLDKFEVSHKIGCKDCSGTHSYRGKWSFLDMIFFSKNMTSKKASYQLIPSSIRTPDNSKYQLRSNSFTPSRFGSGASTDGVSDHLPVAANLRLVKYKLVK
tara:strand:- start:2719 stop:3774 length:1056 start_codon:yes stop_codon:yes gene_type:complete